jgi:hypothetical protein
MKMKTKNTPTLLKSGRALISDRINVRISMVLEINKMSLLGNALIIFSGLRVSLIIRTAIFVLGFTNISTTLIKHKSNIYILPSKDDSQVDCSPATSQVCPLMLPKAFIYNF